MTALSTSRLRAPAIGRPAGRHVVHAALAAGAVGLWVVALRATDLADMRGLGLIDAFPQAFYGALLLALAGCLLSVLRPVAMPRAFATHLALLIVFIHGTASFLYDEPRYPWVYKHLGVIDYIQTHGSIDRTLDIYNNWPGLFALVGMVSDVTGASPADLAPWAQCFFTALTAAAVLFAIRPIVADQRQRLLAVLIVVLGDWVGQNYLSPQGLAFPLTIVTLGIWLRVAPEPATTWLGRRADDVRHGARRVMMAGVRGSRPPLGTSSAPLTPPLDRRTALILGAPLVLAVILTHQLSPVMLIASTILLALTTGRRLGPLLSVMLIVQVGWLAMAWPYLAERIEILHFGGVPSPEIPVHTEPMEYAGLTALSARVAVLVVVGLALIGAVRRLRGGRPAAAAMTLVMAPVMLVPIQSYGGEAGLRAFLFALPWLAVLASDTLMGLGRGALRAASAAGARARAARRVVAVAAVGCVAAAMLGLSTVAYFGAELGSMVGREDVRASVWWEDNAPPGAVLAYLSPGFPNRINAHYAEHEVPSGSFSPSLAEDVYTRLHLLDDATRIPAVIGLMEALGPRERYLVIGPSQIRTLLLFGVLPARIAEGLAGELKAAPEFEVVYDAGGTTVFRYLGETPQ